MELRDLIVTPIIIFLVYVVAYLVRPKVTDSINRKYFFPALTVKIIGALALGFIYQFYYDGGDTFNYHTHGSRHVWEAFVDQPSMGIKLLVNADDDYAGVYEYVSKIPFFRDPASYMVIRIAAIFDLLTFSSYSATAVLFSVLSFIGGWLLFLAFYGQRPHLFKLIAIVTLFVPSVVFWGSGLLKDTIAMSCLGTATFLVFRIVIDRKFVLSYFFLLAITLYGLYSIKIYILIIFIPSIILWIFLFNFQKIKSEIVKILIAPFVFVLSIVSGYYATLKAVEDNSKYSFDTLSKTAQITSYDIRFWTGRDAGSGYTLGELDGSWESMVVLAPQAINVSLFRPYLWEVKNPFMLLASLESLLLIVITVYVIFSIRMNILVSLKNPTILFCLIFSLVFAFAVGVSTFNFGTLMRYKIPLMPYYLLALIFMKDYANRERKFEAFESTE